MIIGEVCNFVAYAFTEAILVTPMGALSVVIWCVHSLFLLLCTINLVADVRHVISSIFLALQRLAMLHSAVLSSIFLKERLTFFGKIGCTLCIIGAVIIAMNGPSEQAAATIPAFQALFVTPWFLAYTSVVVVVCAGLIFWAAPRYGKKNMLVYVSLSHSSPALGKIAEIGEFAWDRSRFVH